MNPSKKLGEESFNQTVNSTNFENISFSNSSSKRKKLTSADEAIVQIREKKMKQESVSSSNSFSVSSSVSNIRNKGDASNSIQQPPGEQMVKTEQMVEENQLLANTHAQGLKTFFQSLKLNLTDKKEIFDEARQTLAQHSNLTSLSLSLNYMPVEPTVLYDKT